MLCKKCKKAFFTSCKSQDKVRIRHYYLLYNAIIMYMVIHNTNIYSDAYIYIYIACNVLLYISCVNGYISNKDCCVGEGIFFHFPLHRSTNDAFACALKFHGPRGMFVSCLSFCSNCCRSSCTSCSSSIQQQQPALLRQSLPNLLL